MNYKEHPFNFFIKNLKINPNKTAVIINKKKISFAELDLLSKKYSNFISKLLFKFRKNEKINIAIFSYKSIYKYALILACLRLNIAYSFLDYKSPSYRLKKIISTLNPKLIFFEKKDNINNIKKINKKFINLDQEYILNTKKKFNNKKNFFFKKNNIAYIMFTSGSSGQPKGVSISYQNLTNFIKWCQNQYNFSNNDIFSNLNALHFDNSVFDIYASIFGGHTLVGINNEEIIDLSCVKKIFNKYKISVWFSVPSLIIFYLNFGFFKAKKNLKYVKKIIFGGEGFPKASLKILFNITKKLGITLVNVYGPTETTCICSSYKITKRDFSKGEMNKFAPIGKKLTYLFNHFFLKENKINDKEGELIIYGKNVGLGYFKKKRETKSKFFIHHISNKKSYHAYKTGDYFYKDLKGYLYFSGRKDQQIKHLGHRIELGEIEQVINEDKNVLECCVIYSAEDSINGGKVKCILSHSGNIMQLKNRIRVKLAKYMYPSEFIVLKVLPKNNNGKIDRLKIKERYS